MGLLFVLKCGAILRHGSKSKVGVKSVCGISHEFMVMNSCIPGVCGRFPVCALGTVCLFDMYAVIALCM